MPPATLTGSAQVAFKAGSRPQPFDPNPALGELVYHYSGDPHGYSRLPAAGGTITPLGTMAGFSPSWGPDGRIVFQGDISPLVIVDGDGSNPVEIPDTTNYLFPSWSPDGSKILAARATDYAIVWLDPVTGAATVVANATRGFFYVGLGSQAWHPASGRIVFTDQAGNRIYTVNVNGTGLTEVPTGLGPDDTTIHQASWSPLGTHIAIGTTGGLYVTRLGGNTHRRYRGLASAVAWSSDGKRLAFTDDDGLNVMNADGTGLTRIINGPVVDAVTWTRRRGSGAAIEMTGLPNFAVMQGQSQFAVNVGPKPTPHDPQPGLGAILYNSRRGDGSWTIFRTPPTAGAARMEIWSQTWDSDADAYNPAWGPDGRVVFKAGNDLVMADGDGDDPVAVGHGESLNYPSWSPDGTTILAYDEADIVAVDLSLGERRVVLAASSFNVNLSSQAWSPDQAQVVFTDTNDNEVWVANADGTGLTEITPIGVGALAAPAKAIEFAAWSPDGTELAIGDHGGLHISDTDGNNVRHTYTGGTAWSVAWAQDGKRLAFVNNTGVAVINADGTGFTQVNSDGNATFLDWSRQQPPITLTAAAGDSEPEPAPGTVSMTGYATVGFSADAVLWYPALPPRVSGTFYDRWRSGLHIGDARPGQRVQIRRGRFDRRHGKWLGEDPISGVHIAGYNLSNPWQPYWTPLSAYVDVPSVREVRLDQSTDQNGITTATLVIDNIFYRPEAGGQHSIERGQYASLRGYVGPDRTRLTDEQGQAVFPDPTWFGLLMQDAQITVYQSYGNQEIKTFTGLIDDVDTTSHPDVITVTARDFGKILTDSFMFGWNKEWPDEGESLFRDPTIFIDPDDADNITVVGHDATASSGTGASNVLDGDGDTSWTSDKHTTSNITEYVQVRLDDGRYNDFKVNLPFDGMEMYVSLLPKERKHGVSATRNGVDIPENHWVDGGSGDTVPGANGGIYYLRHITDISEGTHQYNLTSDEDSFRVGDDSILRLSFRHLQHPQGSTRYAASVIAVKPLRRTILPQARKQHWVLVDDAADIVRVVLRWAGFKEFEVESTGAPLSKRLLANRGMTYMDVIKQVAELCGYVFFMSDPSSRPDSLGVPIFRKSQIVTNTPSVVTVKDTDLLTAINVKQTDEPLAYIIRMRGRVAKKGTEGATLGGDKTRRVMYVYRPPWSGGFTSTPPATVGVRPKSHELGGIIRHVIHTNNMFKTLDDCKFACYYLALNEALAASTTTIQIPAHPGIQLDDHIELLDLGTGTTSRLSVTQRSSEFARSGEHTVWVMTLAGALIDTPDVTDVVYAINHAKRA